MAFIRSILTWLGLERRSARVGLRPHRSLEVPLTLSAAYQKCLEGTDRILGATVYRNDFVPERGYAYIEAGFGLVNSERLRISLERLDDLRTGIRIEAAYPANVLAPERSAAVEALADYLSL